MGQVSQTQGQCDRGILFERSLCVSVSLCSCPMFGLGLARHVLTDPAPTANFIFFLEELSFNLYICIFMSICHVYAGAQKGQKRVLDPWKWIRWL